MNHYFWLLPFCWHLYQIYHGIRNDKQTRAVNCLIKRNRKLGRDLQVFAYSFSVLLGVFYYGMGWSPAVMALLVSQLYGYCVYHNQDPNEFQVNSMDDVRRIQ